MSATSRTTTITAPPTTPCTKAPNGAAQYATPNAASNVAPANNASAAQPLQTNSTGAQNTTPTLNQQPLAPSAQSAPLPPSANHVASTSSTQYALVPKNRGKSKKLSHLSHISAATWMGVGLALAALIVAIYYGAPMWRLARWTALNDFRASCVSDHDRGIHESVSCKTILAGPAKPPPVVKRAVGQAFVNVWTTALRWALTITVPVATLIAYFVFFKRYAEEEPPLQWLSKPDVSKVLKCGSEMERLAVITPPWMSGPAQEQGGRKIGEDYGYDVDDRGQTGIHTNDSASEFDWDNGQIHTPFTNLYLKMGSVGSSAALYSKDRIHSVQVPHNLWNNSSSNSSTHYLETVKSLGDLQHSTRIGNADIDQDPILIDGPTSAFKPADSIMIKDLRKTKTSNIHLRGQGADRTWRLYLQGQGELHVY